jgi:hypothetical protein
MEKVYLLLRNNVQTGPFTLQQLQNQQISPKDLIWIEGKSNCWRSVRELGGPEKWLSQLHQSEANRTQNQNHGYQQGSSSNVTFSEIAQHEFTITTPSSPDEVLEKWAEAIRNRASAYTAAHPERAFQHPEVPTIKPYTYYSDENPIEVVIHKKGVKTISGVQLLIIAAATTIITASWYGKLPILSVRPQAAYTAIAGAPSVFRVEPKQEKLYTAPVPVPEAVVSTTVAANDIPPSTIAHAVAEKSAKPAPASISSPEIVESEKATASQQTEVMATKPLVSSSEKKSQEEVNTKEMAIEKQVEKTTIIVTEEENQAKRKTFGQAIKGLFKKKKKDTNEDAPDSPAESQ